MKESQGQAIASEIQLLPQEQQDNSHNMYAEDQVQTHAGSGAGTSVFVSSYEPCWGDPLGLVLLMFLISEVFLNSEETDRWRFWGVSFLKLLNQYFDI